jgi:two-component system OmpR family response regulator
MRLLVVGDDVDLEGALAGALRDEGHTVDRAPATDDALSRTRLHDYDAVVLDVTLLGADALSLLARLRGLIRRAAYETAPVLEVGDLRIEPETRAVTRAGRPVELSPREFALLEFLARHRGETVSRTQLLKHVWGERSKGSTNTVDVYVAYLRRKLGSRRDAPLIRTVRGVGFVLDALGG